MTKTALKQLNLKRGDRIEVEGIDWSTRDEWTTMSEVLDKILIYSIQYLGFYVGVKQGNLVWSNIHLTWGEEGEEEVKYTQTMSLAAIKNIRKLRFA